MPVIEKSMMDDEQRASFEAAENEKFEKRSEAAKRGAETRQANLLKQNSPDSAKGKEVEGFNCSTSLKEVLSLINGKGGGKPDMAQGSGESSADLNVIDKKIQELI